MKKLVLAAAVLGAAALAPQVDAKCAMAHLKYRTLTTQKSVAPGGGIVVATVEAAYDEKTPDADDDKPGWIWDTGSRAQAATADKIAPGLVVYRVPADIGQAVKLRDKKAIHGEVTLGKDKPALLAAPVLVKANLDKQLGRFNHSITTVTLGAPPPAGAVALVLADDKGTPRSFGVVQGGGKDIVVYNHTRCGVVPNGTVESAKGDKVLVFWVDQSGRESPFSSSVTLTGNTPKDSGD